MFSFQTSAAYHALSSEILDKWTKQQQAHSSTSTTTDKETTASSSASASSSEETSSLPQATDIDLRGARSVHTLHQFIIDYVTTHSPMTSFASEQDIIIRPVKAALSSPQAMYASHHPMDNGVSTISVGRSFGLSTTQGARGDAVSYILVSCSSAAAYHQTMSQTAAAAAAAAAVVHTHEQDHPHIQKDGRVPIAVVKVIKSAHVFEQEVLALTLIQKLFSQCKSFSFPSGLHAARALIPLTIPTVSSSTSTSSDNFSRPYSVSALTTSTMGSTSSSSSTSSATEPYARGGILIMQCALGVPLSDYFSEYAKISKEHTTKQIAFVALQEAIRVAATALAELHSIKGCQFTIAAAAAASNPPTAPSSIIIDRTSKPTVNPKLMEELYAQMQDMFGKLSVSPYKEIAEEKQIDVNRLKKAVDQLYSRLLQATNNIASFVHGDAHAGNMLWDAERKLLTIIDWPTILASICLQSQPTPHTQGASSPSSSSSSSLSTSDSSPSTSSSMTEVSLHIQSQGLTCRDTSHFERKLDSQGLRLGLQADEVQILQETFRQEYTQHIDISQSADFFCRTRSLMGEVTQLIKYEPKSIDARVLKQIEEIFQLAQV